MSAGEPAAMAFGFGIHDEIHFALAIERDRLGSMARDRAKTHLLEQGVELGDIGGRVFDEFETIGTDGVSPKRIHGSAFVSDETNIVSSETFWRSTASVRNCPTNIDKAGG